MAMTQTCNTGLATEKELSILGLPPGTETTVMRIDIKYDHDKWFANELWRLAERLRLAGPSLYLQASVLKEFSKLWYPSLDCPEMILTTVVESGLDELLYDMLASPISADVVGVFQLNFVFNTDCDC